MYHRVKIVNKPWRVFAMLCSVMTLMATAASAQIPPDATAMPVGTVNLLVESSTPEQRRLDVGLAIFDPGIPLNEASHSMLGIFPEIRKRSAEHTS